jgi:TolA-binding protein
VALAERPDELGARAQEGMAWCAFELGEDQACADRLQRAMAHPQAAPRKPGLLELKAALHQRRQQWGEAAATATAFLQEFAQHPRAPAMRYALGLSQARGGDKTAARKTLAALAKDGGYERMDRVYYELGWACRRDGDEPAALAAFAEVVKGSKDAELMGEARLHLGQAAIDQGQLDKARELMTAVEGSHRGRALYQLGFAELQAADAAAAKSDAAKSQALLQRASAAFTTIVAIGKGEALSGEATFCLGECRMRLQELQPAADAFAALLQREPQHARAQQARLHLGECELKLDKAAEAASHLDEFLRGKVETAERPQALLMLGKARLARGEHKEAEAAFTSVTSLSEGPLAAEAQFRLGESRQARGDTALAAEAFVALSILYAHDEWVQKGLLQAGLCYQSLQQPEKARKFFDELVRRYPKSAEAEQARAHLK